ncbi:EAL domain-containing protein [Propionivibrio limicola]|uniref:EAL domain-containing protein n=1 Tax=Propionivibrio limicola TaxID=167645 RepID=UPI001290980E|nr:EAL domain-containing protein [Propionivibrio limicola]
MDKQWSLESVGTDGARVELVIPGLPCSIGRGKENDLVVANPGLSRVHAVLTRDITGQLRLVDENSTNGTFVNRQRIDGYCLLKENDIIHFASAEFRLRCRWAEQSSVLAFDEMGTMVLSPDMVLPQHFLPNEAEFDELIMGRGLSGAAQPIVDAQTRRVVAYELLGRANHPQLPKSPIELFGMARAMDREVELSLAFREFGISEFAPRLAGHTLFLNAHPKETFSEVFFANLERIRRASPRLGIVVEIHESAVTDVAQLHTLAHRLEALDIRFAYDDFGAGQARLLELADVPAHFVKFDMSLIRGLHKASPRKQKVVRDLVQMVLATGSVPLAEGVEDEDEARACVDMGFQLIQGYLTGKPVSAASL